MSNEILTIVVQAIVGIAVVLITRYLIPLLIEKMGEDKYLQACEYCELAVRSAEQLFTPEEWERKKAYVVSCMSAKLNKLGLELSEVEVNAIIEGVVNAVKKNNGN